MDSGTWTGPSSRPTTGTFALRSRTVPVTRRRSSTSTRGSSAVATSTPAVRDCTPSTYPGSPVTSTGELGTRGGDSSTPATRSRPRSSCSSCTTGRRRRSPCPGATHLSTPLRACFRRRPRPSSGVDAPLLLETFVFTLYRTGLGSPSFYSRIDTGSSETGNNWRSRVSLG